MTHESVKCFHNNLKSECLLCFSLRGAPPHRHVPRMVEEKPYVPNTVVESEDAEGNRVLLCSHMTPLFTECKVCNNHK